jgi:hypothetical protein
MDDWKADKADLCTRGYCWRSILLQMQNAHDSDATLVTKAVTREGF